MNEKDIQNISHIGKKIRAARLHQQLSLRELAEKAEVSPSLLSKVENSKANPSVRSLHSIAEALSLSVNSLFPDTESAKAGETLVPDSRTESGPVSSDVSEMTAAELRAAQAAALVDEVELGFDHDKHPSQGPVIRAGNRPTIELLGDVTWARLTPGREAGIEFLEILYDPGASSGVKMSHHAGREFHLVLEGELLLELGFERYLLNGGDSIIFDSETPHRLSNSGQTPMRAISVIFNTQ